MSSLDRSYVPHIPFRRRAESSSFAQTPAHSFHDSDMIALHNVKIIKAPRGGAFIILYSTSAIAESAASIVGKEIIAPYFTNCLNPSVTP